MCGLAGIIDFDAPAEPELAAAMGRALAHRGPDDEGSFAEAGVALAFRALPEPLEPNLDAIRDYLALGLIDHREETFVSGIRRLPAGHNLVFDADRLRVRRYWGLELRDPPAGDPAEAVRELFLDSIRLH